MKEFKDPFYEYGYGVVAFFKLTRNLIAIFFVLSLVVALPAIISYPLLNVGKVENDNFFFQTTLANSGAAGIHKFLVPLGKGNDSIKLQCENSFIVENPVFGILPQNSTYMKEKYIAYKSPRLSELNIPNYDDFQMEDPCDDAFHFRQLSRNFTEKCIKTRTQNCTIEALSGYYRYPRNNSIPSCYVTPDPMSSETFTPFFFAQI